jgi:NADH:ubiquinone oxidoreductase subunit F (NADH-binding)
LSADAATTELSRAPQAIGRARVLLGGPARLVLEEAQAPGWGLASERELGYFTYDGGSTILDELQSSGLRGRGGAGFPAHIKWRTVASAAGGKVVVANGHEGEPASAKDRWLLANRPHLVLDGLFLAATTVGADRAIVYVSHPDSIRAVRQAIAEVTAAGLVPAGLRLECFEASGGYVAGEESAVCRAINGGPALPTDKPPRPFEAGVDALPTLVTNVETLAQAAWIANNGAKAFRGCGTEASSGTALFTLLAPDLHGVIYEAPMGSTIGDLFAAAGGKPENYTGLLMGGWFGGVLQGDLVSLACSYEAVAARGSGLGAAAITALGPDDDPVAIAVQLAAWFQQESAGQCGVCINGTKSIHKSLRRASNGTDSQLDRENLLRWGTTLSGRGACAFVNGSATLARSISDELSRRSMPLLNGEKTCV